MGAEGAWWQISRALDQQSYILRGVPVETFWVVLVLLSHPGETRVIREGFHGHHYATQKECLGRASELAMALVRSRWIATTCEERIGKPGPPDPAYQRTNASSWHHAPAFTCSVFEGRQWRFGF
jgi:hypothetical protein